MSFKKLKTGICVLTFSFLSIICISESTYAASFSGGRQSASFNCYYDSSVSSFGYVTAYNTAISNWNNTSSKVSISKTSSTSGNPDKYYIGNSSTAGLLGRITPYKKDVFGRVVEANLNERWLYSTVALYDNNMKKAGMSSSQIHSNATHEVGHTLSQAHPNTSSASVMKQGVQSIGPTSYDKSSIISKWGK